MGGHFKWADFSGPGGVAVVRRRSLARLMLAIQFGTIFPVPLSTTIEPDDLRLSLAWLPAVGALLGGLLWGLMRLMVPLLASGPRAIIGVAFYTVATGGLHLDGLADTFDALGSRKPAAQALAIMKDSRIGTMGTLALVLLLAGKATAFFYLRVSVPGVWIMVPAVARLSALWVLAGLPAVHRDGLAARWAQRLPWPAIATATAVTLAALVLLLPVGDAAMLALGALVISGGWAWAMKRRFGGINGDMTGALIELVEWTGFLLMTSATRHGSWRL